MVSSGWLLRAASMLNSLSSTTRTRPVSRSSTSAPPVRRSLCARPRSFSAAAFSSEVERPWIAVKKNLVPG